MNNTSSFEKLSNTGNLDSNLTYRRCKVDLMATFKEIKSFNPKLRQHQVAKELGC